VAPKDDEAEKKPGDPLKAYCYVLGFLLLFLLGIWWFKIRVERDAYAAANVRAEQYLTGKGLRKSPDDEPVTIPDIAYNVEKFVETYKSSLSDGGNAPGIPLELVSKMASNAGMTQDGVQTERTEQNVNAGYETRSRVFDYKTPVNLKNLLTLVYNIETRGRYRVNEIRWQIADKKDNSAPPFHAITKPVIKVAVRTPIQRK
jgi:hypothetical protein